MRLVVGLEAVLLRHVPIQLAVVERRAVRVRVVAERRAVRRVRVGQREVRLAHRALRREVLRLVRVVPRGVLLRRAELGEEVPPGGRALVVRVVPADVRQLERVRVRREGVREVGRVDLGLAQHRLRDAGEHEAVAAPADYPREAVPPELEAVEAARDRREVDAAGERVVLDVHDGELRREGPPGDRAVEVVAAEHEDADGAREGRGVERALQRAVLDVERDDGVRDLREVDAAAEGLALPLDALDARAPRDGEEVHAGPRGDGEEGRHRRVGRVGRRLAEEGGRREVGDEGLHLGLERVQGVGVGGEERDEGEGVHGWGRKGAERGDNECCGKNREMKLEMDVLK